MSATTPGDRFRFGVFEVDCAVGELRRQGLRVKLNAQPFQVLAMMLARPGELLTREEIARDLWPDGTFVDYEQGVNSAVNRIREALGDSASRPRFIETLARKGYRFVAPVERVGAVQAVVPTQEPVVDAPEPVWDGRILASEEELAKAPHRVVLGLFVALQLLYVGFYVGALCNLPEIDELLAVLPYATAIFSLVVATAAALIPVRAFVLFAVFFRPPNGKRKILKIWRYLLAFDMFWALSPFLLLHHIDFGLALACTSLLVYSPFAQRSLVLMGAGSDAVA